MQRPTATRVIDRLEEQGLVTRSPDPEDRRSHRIALSAEGRRLLSDVRSRRAAYLARGLEGLSEDERHALRRAAEILDRLLAEDP